MQSDRNMENATRIEHKIKDTTINYSYKYTCMIVSVNIHPTKKQALTLKHEDNKSVFRLGTLTSQKQSILFTKIDHFSHITSSKFLNFDLIPTSLNTSSVPI